MKPISIGKYRGMQKIAAKNGGLSILALDHRNNLRKAINPSHPEWVDDAELSRFKVAVTKALTPHASAILLDPEVGVLQSIAENAIHKSSGVIIALEETGYTGEPNARESRLLHGWSVERAKLIGVDAVKLLIYYHPQSPKAKQIEELVASVASQCEKWDILFMIEPLTYSIDPQDKKLKGDARKEMILETAQRLSNMGGDILKVEFPVDIETYPDESKWAVACRELTNALEIPWILLSASVDFDTYLKQVIIACQAGAAGIAAGRAVWIEAINKSRDDLDMFLSTTASSRMEQLTSTVDSLTKPWTSFYHLDFDFSITD